MKVEATIIFFLVSKRGKSDKNYNNNFEILLHFEQHIVAE